jgi:HEPN domain-containing protein
MIDSDKQAQHWREGAEDEWTLAGELIARGRVRHGLFFAHLALEKLLKAHVCRHTRDLAPRSHNLPRLAELGGIVLSQEQHALLERMNDFNLEGRYPEMSAPLLTLAEAESYLARASEVYEWLMGQF